MSGPKKIIRGLFPKLGVTDFKVTSDKTPAYNCIAWAAGSDSRFWWPSTDAYWPPQVPQVESLAAFEHAFAGLGYVKCDDGTHKIGIEKIAIYADSAGKPKHAARQLKSGSWTSKLGPYHDIEHKTPYGIEGAQYGQIAVFMERPMPD